MKRGAKPILSEYDPNKAKAGLLWKEVNSKYAK